MSIPMRFKASLIILALAATGCGSSGGSSPTTPSTATSQTTSLTYSGTYQQADDSYGTISLTAQIPSSLGLDTGGVSFPRAVVTASGTLKPSGPAVQLSGTYDASTRTFNATGGGYTVAATVTTDANGDILNGSVNTVSTQGTLVAVVPPPTGTVPFGTFCGNFSGASKGTLVITRRDSKLYLLISERGAAARYSVVGNISGTDISVSWHYRPPDVGMTTVTGTLAAGVMSGIWVAIYDDGPVSHRDTGEWVARAGSCLVQ